MEVDFVCNSLTLLAMINTFISSTNITGLESLFMPRGRSLIYIINNNGAEIHP
jgi:hypothetical protein